MRVLASEPATRLIEEGGGRLYVWPKRRRCCGGVTTLATAATPPARTEFRLADRSTFELYLPASLERLPDELHVELHRFTRRVDAYWNGCAWVI